MKPAKIPPDGLGEFLQKKFGGTLIPSKHEKFAAHALRLNTQVRGARRVSHEEIAAAVVEYYGSVGMHAQSILNPEDLCFSAENDEFTLVVSLSNFTAEGDPNSRILITVDDHNHV